MPNEFGVTGRVTEASSPILADAKRGGKAESLSTHLRDNPQGDSPSWRRLRVHVNRIEGPLQTTSIKSGVPSPFVEETESPCQLNRGSPPLSAATQQRIYRENG